MFGKKRSTEEKNELSQRQWTRNWGHAYPEIVSQWYTPEQLKEIKEEGRVFRLNIPIPRASAQPDPVGFAQRYRTLDGATGVLTVQTRKEFQGSLGEDIARAIAAMPPAGAAKPKKTWAGVVKGK